MSDFMTVEQLMKRLSQFAPDTKIVGFVGAPDNLMGKYGFIPTEADWEKIIDRFSNYAGAGVDNLWDAFADAKADVLSEFLCWSCDSYSYTCESFMGNEPFCATCHKIELDDNTI